MATKLFQYVTILIASVLTAACASTQSSSDAAFSNILVLAISENYDSRARYERSVAAELRKLGATAMPYYEAVGGKDQISRSKAQELIAEHGFDAVLVTQVRQSKATVDVEQDSAAMKVTRKDDRPIDFFRYDYEELDEPGAMSLLAEATLDTNLHRASDAEIVWSYSWTSKAAENVGLLIDESSRDLVRRMSREKVVGK